MASEEEVQLYNAIIEKGCCKRCALRYMGFCKSLVTFDHPDTCLMNFGLIPLNETLLGEPNPKVRKKNPCSVCLGLLEDHILDQMLVHDNLSQAKEYASSSFVAYITFPTCISLREHSMKIYLERKFPKCFDVNKVIKVNHAWRYSVQERLCQILKKSYNYLSKFTLHFYTDYILEEDELSVVQNGTSETLSKHLVAALLNTVTNEEFESLVTIPPRTPLYEVKVKDLKCYSESIHLIGKYCKYSRQLQLVPQIVENIVVEEYSTEKIILDAVKNVLVDYKDATFKAASFDEQFVRILGDGKYFHLQINNPKFERVTSYHCYKIAREVKKSKLVEIKNLHEDDRKNIITIIESQQLSPRSFKILCKILQCKNIDYCINAINMYSTITVQQKTPVRFLHTRKCKTKKKKIYYIRANQIKDNLIELELCTDCAFYVEEFVSGDFGRTKPSLGEIMKANVIFLTLDVVDFSSTVPYIAEIEELNYL